MKAFSKPEAPEFPRTFCLVDLLEWTPGLFTRGGHCHWRCLEAVTNKKERKERRKKSQSSCSVKFKGIPKEAEREDESGSVARLLQRWSRYQLRPCSTRAPGGLSTPHKTRSTLRNDPRHVVLLSLRGKLEFPLKWPLTRREIIMLSGGVRSQGLERGGNITVCAAADTTLHLTLSRAGYRFKTFCI